MKQVLFSLFLLILFSGSTCQQRFPPMPIEPLDTDQCPAACEHLRELGCPEGDDLPDGTTCEDFCVESQKNGFPLNPTCVKGISSCLEINDCAP